MKRYDKILISIGILAGLFLLWIRLGGVAGIAEIALNSAVDIRGTSPYATRQLLTSALGTDTKARYLLLFHSNEDHQYVILRLSHGIPSIEKQGKLSTTTTFANLATVITFTPPAVDALHIVMYEPIFLSSFLPTTVQELKNIKTQLDNHSILLSSRDERLQKIFINQGWTSTTTSTP